MIGHKLHFFLSFKNEINLWTFYSSEFWLQPYTMEVDEGKLLLRRAYGIWDFLGFFEDFMGIFGFFLRFFPTKSTGCFQSYLPLGGWHLVSWQYAWLPSTWTPSSSTLVEHQAPFGSSFKLQQRGPRHTLSSCLKGNMHLLPFPGPYLGKQSEKWIWYHWKLLLANTFNIQYK